MFVNKNSSLLNSKNLQYLHNKKQLHASLPIEFPKVYIVTVKYVKKNCKQFFLLGRSCYFYEGITPKN